MDGNELRDRLDKLQLTYRAAAERLGLSVPGLYHQLRGQRPVSRQTELLLEVLEARRHSYITVSSPMARNARPLVNRALHGDAGKTITSVDLEAISLRNALGDIDQFVFRHKAFGQKIDKLIREARLLLLDKLDGAELHQLEAHRDRPPRFEIVDDDPT